MWHLNWAKLIGLSGHIKLTKEQEALCDRLDIARDGRQCSVESIRNKRVWEDVLVPGFAKEDKK
jgi:hypothetical protein